MPGGDSLFFASLDGLEKALDIQGGLQGADVVRTASGIYLYHEIGDYLSRQQTFQVAESVALDGAAGTDLVGDAPSSTGMRYGRYLTFVGVSTGAAPANLTGWAVYIRNSGVQPNYPILGSPAPFLYGGNTARQINANTWILVPDVQPVTIPVWLPPGSFLRLYVKLAGASAAYTLTANFHTTEQLNALGTAAAGLPRAPVKV